MIHYTLEKKLLEKKLSNLMHLKHFIFTGYARNGLYLLIKALNWDNNAHIIIPAFTCSVIPKTIEAAGAIPVPVDSEDLGLNISPEKIEKAITKHTKAIYVIHTYGTAAKINEICAIANKYNLLVIEDVAHSLFSQYKGKQLGTFGDFAILSFTKKLINYEGGAIGTNNTAVYKKITALQQNYRKSAVFYFSDYIDDATRLIGAFWETKFSFLTLIVMKMLDIWENIFFEGQYGLHVDQKKFFMRRLSMRITLIQLDLLNKKTKKEQKKHITFRNKFSNRLEFPKINQKEKDSFPLYNVGLFKKNFLYLLISYRTWRNPNKKGLFPRADHIYSNCRLFSSFLI